MVRIRIDGTCFLWWAVLLMLVPLRWLAAAGGAACVHELGHLLAVHILDGRVLCLTVRQTGLVMETTCMTPGKCLAAALAGPLCGLMLAAGAGHWPLTALCALIQSIWNLLPLGKSDGRTILRCIMTLFRERKGQTEKSLAKSGL